MTFTRVVLVSLFHATFLTSAGIARAQVSTVPLGARVRVEAREMDGGPFEGILFQRSGDTIRLRENDSVVTIPVNRLHSVDVSRGGSRMDGARTGAVRGAVVGLLMGLASYATLKDVNHGQFIVFSTLVTAKMGAEIGALTGRERWDPVDLHASSSPAP